MRLSYRELVDLIESSAIEFEEVNNYTHTHWRCRYHPEERYISFEEVCVNEYGSCFG